MLLKADYPIFYSIKKKKKSTRDWWFGLIFNAQFIFGKQCFNLFFMLNLFIKFFQDRMLLLCYINSHLIPFLIIPFALRKILLYHLSFFLSVYITLRLTFVKHSEAATRGALCKKLFLEISQNLQENTCARSLF